MINRKRNVMLLS